MTDQPQPIPPPPSDAEMHQQLQKKADENNRKIQTAMSVIRRFGPPRNKLKVELDDKNVVEFYTHDEYGLALDPKLWCKSSCTDCNGSGRIWKYTQRVVKKGEKGQPDKTEPHREMHPCPRANRRYNSKREEVVERLHRAKTRGGEDAEVRALEKIHAENGHGIKLTKSPLDLRTPSGEKDVSVENTATQLSTNTAT